MAADPGLYARVKQAFLDLEALDECTRSERLAELRARDPDLAEQVAKRLQSQSVADVLSRAERQGQTPELPNYRIIRELGRGGMGRVWLAERVLDDTRQIVALKQILSGQWDEDEVRRFQRERRILASLDHPNIAALIDGGRDAEGAPFLATAFVDGEPLDRWCQQRQLPTRARVELLRGVVAAVAYAHRKLIVHRDLKPANILVTQSGVPKLLDFGIARLLDEKAITATGPSQMTLRYAAPEQVQAQGEVGTSVDIYALGVLLYELITGVSPYGEIQGAVGLVRAILQLEPVPPSQRVPAIDRDLDAICLKALRKRAEDRYVSAEAMLADLDHWLRGDAVDARRGERGYQLRAFLRRRWPVLATIAAVLIGAAVFLSYHLQLLDAQLQETERERDKARAIASYFQELFASANPNETRGDALTAKELLKRSVTRLDQGDTSALDDDARASMYHAAGRIMRAQGLSDEARHLFERALGLWLKQAKVPEDEVADVYNELYLVDFAAGRYAESLAHIDTAIARREVIRDRESVVLGVLKQQRSVPLRMLGRTREAAESLDSGLSILRRHLPEGQANFAIGLGNLGTVLLYEGRAREGHEKLKESIAVLTELKPERTAGLLALQRNLATSYRELADYATAEREYRHNLARLAAFHGQNSPELARTWHALAQLYLVQDRLDEAEHALGEAERIEHAAGVINDPRLLAYRADRARVHIARKQYVDAIRDLDAVLAKRNEAVISERASADSERAAHAYAHCMLTPSTTHLAALKKAEQAMHGNPPLPYVLLERTAAWVSECQTRVLGEA